MSADARRRLPFSSVLVRTGYLKMPELDLEFVDQMVAEIGNGPETVIPILVP